MKKLQGEGFDRVAAEKLAATFPIEQILQQIDWIDNRRVKRSRLGMLRSAIEQNWTKPNTEKLGRPNLPTEEASELNKARWRLSKQFNSFHP